MIATVVIIHLHLYMKEIMIKRILQSLFCIFITTIYAEERLEENNPDVLFQEGRRLSQKGEWKEAEIVLKKCLKLAPQYTDAALQLARIYTWEGRVKEAEAIYNQYPNNIDAKRGLVANWNRSFDMRSHLNPTILMDFFHTSSKEDDPTLKAPVVKTYYDYVAPALLVPLIDTLRLDLKGIVFRQQENNIYQTFAVNYKALITGGEASSHYLFLKNWKWNLVLRGLSAQNTGINNAFPFKDTVRFEPGTSIMYANGSQIGVIDLHVESFIIKNFSKIISELLRTDQGELRYVCQPDVYYHPYLEAWLNESFYHDNLHNRRDIQGFEGRICLLRTSKLISGIYRFEHAHFKKLNRNYFSFDQQFRNTLGVKLYHDFLSGISLELIYERSFQNTYKLFQPIGDFLFIAKQQKLKGNRITGNVFYQWKDHLRIKLGGHYFRDTLPYRDWNINGSILWQF